MKTRQMLGFFVLSLLSYATWLTADLLPSLVPPIEGEGFRLLLVGVVGLLLRLATRRPGIRPTFADCAFVGLASLGLIGVPFLLLASAAGKVASTNVVVMFAGMPILLAVAGASSSSQSGLRVLPAGSMGLAGLLILLPLTAPTWRSWVAGGRDGASRGGMYRRLSDVVASAASGFSDCPGGRAWRVPEWDRVVAGGRCFNHASVGSPWCRRGEFAMPAA